MIDARAQRLIDLLGLSPHPEGGFFRETFRSDSVVTLLPEGTKPNASTAIYYLLPSGAFSAFHRIRRSDEVWHHYGGAAIELHRIESGGEHQVEVLGVDLEHGERPQIVIPAGTLQAAVTRGTGFALCGCLVLAGRGPGGDRGAAEGASGQVAVDFEMPTRDELLARFPQQEEIIRRFTRI